MRLDWIFLPRENPCAKFYIVIIIMNNFLNRLLVEIIISSCLCVGFTEYKNLIIF